MGRQLQAIHMNRLGMGAASGGGNSNGSGSGNGGLSGNLHLPPLPLPLRKGDYVVVQITGNRGHTLRGVPIARLSNKEGMALRL